MLDQLKEYFSTYDCTNRRKFIFTLVKKFGVLFVGYWIVYFISLFVVNVLGIYLLEQLMRTLLSLLYLIVILSLAFFFAYVPYCYYNEKKENPNITSLKLHRKQGNYKDNLATGFLVRYLISVVIGIVAGSIFVLFMILLCSLKYWYSGDPLYELLSMISRNLGLCYVIFIIFIILCISYYYFKKPLEYVDEIIQAANSLTTDIHKPIILKNELKEVQDNLNQIRMDAIDAKNEAEENEKKKNDLIVYLAHDLKTPLTSTIGYLSLLDQEKNISEDLRNHYTEVALDKAYRLEDLINQFFEITRFNVTKMELSLSTINISRLLEQTIFEFQPSLKKKDLNINLKCPSVCSLLCDGDKIARVFDNLIKNAINYSYPNTTIDFDVKQEEENTTFVITNHGQTIHPDKCKRLFDAFYRGEYARNSETGGSGLGLAICKDIVEHHGGSITVESRDELIIFTVILPNKSTVINSSEFH